jgi:copper-binding protein NosD
VFLALFIFFTFQVRSIHATKRKTSEDVVFRNFTQFSFNIFCMGGTEIGTVTAQEDINWLELCRTPIIDSLITEPCETLITPDGQSPTTEGLRVLACVAVDYSGVLSPELTFLRSLGPSLGCSPGVTSQITPFQSPYTGGPQIGNIPACGQVVRGNVTLTANLNCNGGGLIVGERGTIINLNGYGIYGPGADSSKVGIGVSEPTNNVIINGPGIISGFQAGILVTGARELTANSLIIQNNQIGVFFTGGNLASVHENIIKNNNIAVATHTSSGINIESNLMEANALAGITFVNTDESAVSSNTIQGSQNAVFLDEQSTQSTVQLNNAHDNVVDMNNANGVSLTVNQNTFTNNECLVSNPAGFCIGG